VRNAIGFFPYHQVMRGKWILLVASAVGIALAAGAVSLLRRGSAERTERATAVPAVSLPAPPASEVSVPGKIRAQHVVDVAPPHEGVVGEFFFDVGQEVFEGQRLARLTSEGLEAANDLAKRAAEAAQNRVNGIESSVHAARLEASRARADATRARGEFDRIDRTYRRQEMLYREGATPRMAYEKANREFKAAESEMKNLDDLATRAEDRVSVLVKELDAARRALAERNDELETAGNNLAAADVLSPTDGIITSRKGAVGEPVGPNTTDFFQIATDLTQLEVVLEPEPLMLKQIQAGQPALVIVADQAGDGILGAVKAIQGTQVIVEFTSPNPALKPGMTAQVRIKTK
jgi:HlyD family secretion protein